MKKILINAYIVTVDQERRIIENGYLIVSGNRIEDLGSMEDYPGARPEDELLDCRNKMMLPGLIDVHAHAGHSMFTLLGSASPSNWMPMMTELYHHNTTEEFWYKEGLLAALSRARLGVTCGLSVLTNCQRSDNPAIGVNHAKAYAELGLREIIAVGPSNPPYPRQITEIRKNGEKLRKSYSYEDLLWGAEETIRLVHHAHHDFIRAVIAPFVLVTSVNASSLTTPDIAVNLTEHDRRMMKDIREIAKRQKTRIHTEAFGGMIRMVKDDPNALLGPDVHLQHCTGISMDEAVILAQTKTHVSSTPSAGQLISRCPVIELLEMGTNVVTSTDGSAPSSGYDLIRASQNMRMIHQGALRDRYYFPTGLLLEMITINAAKAIGWEDEIGSLEVGKKADLILIDLNQPHLTPRTNVLDKWMLMGSGHDVVTVMVDGDFVMRDREMLRVDADKVLEDAHEESLATIKRAGFIHFLEPCDSYWGSTRMYTKEKRF